MREQCNPGPILWAGHRLLDVHALGNTNRLAVKGERVIGTSNYYNTNTLQV